MIHSCFMEFGFDMIAAAPVAYYLLHAGNLDKTVGPAGSAPVYFFSPDHDEVERCRSTGWSRLNTLPEAQKRWSEKDIYIEDVTQFPWWKCPPYREHYAGKTRHARPVVAIFNKFDLQWGQAEPVNYLPLNVLRALCNELRDEYHIVYVRCPWVTDNNMRMLNVADTDYLQRHCPYVEVLGAENLEEWNRKQFELCAMAKATLAVQGGSAILCAMCSAKTFIYAIMGREIQHDTYAWFGNLSGCDVKYVRQNGDVRVQEWMSHYTRDITGDYADLVLGDLL